jgi:hypothetical protein
MILSNYCLGALIWMDCHPEHDRDFYWSTKNTSPAYNALITSISRVEFEQTNRFFHVISSLVTLVTPVIPVTPVTPVTPTTSARPNEKVEEIGVYLTKRF